MSSPEGRQPDWSPFVDATAFERFWQLVTEHAATVGDTAADRTAGVIRLDLGDREVECDLLNLAQLCARAPRERWTEMVIAQFAML